MATFTAKARNLRIFTPSRKSVKFSGGTFTTNDRVLADEVRDLVTSHPQYGIEETGAAQVPPTSNGGSTGDEFDAMNVNELRDEARGRGLAVGGNRSELLARLRGEEGEED